MLTPTKIGSSSYSYSACENKEHPGNCPNKSASSPFKWVSRYILFLAKLKRKWRPFLESARWEVALWDYPPRALACHKRWKSSFVKFEIILLLLCCLLDPLTNKHCRAWSSMINLWIHYRVCQKYRILLSARQSFNN